MIKIRVRFSKHGPVKYVGHLDMMRYFQKAIRRAEINICYSEGFSPHQIMSFASPLGVGMESDAEYFDMQVHDTPEAKEAIARLNAQMAEGIEVMSYVTLPDNAKKSMAVTFATDYCVYPRADHVCVDGAGIADFLAQPEILVLKKTKKNEIETDIRPWIYEMEWRGDHLFCKLSSSSAKSLNVKLLLETYCTFCHTEYDALGYQIVRTEVYQNGASDGKAPVFVPLDQPTE